MQSIVQGPAQTSNNPSFSPKGRLKDVAQAFASIEKAFMLGERVPLCGHARQYGNLKEEMDRAIHWVCGGGKHAALGPKD